MNPPQDISYTEIVSHWLETHAGTKTPHVYHLDISMGVESGRNDLLFSLAVLGGLVDRDLIQFSLSFGLRIPIIPKIRKAQKGLVFKRVSG